jgi:archaellum component FlaF (FlaF/FlaG flagellin family)
MLRNGGSGSFELYQVVDAGVLSGNSVGSVGNSFQVRGFGFFSQTSATQMLMQSISGDASNGQLELYTYQASTASLAGINVGTVGSNLNVVDCADLLGNGETQMVMQQNNGNFWLYTYSASTNSLSGRLVGAVGSNFHVVGFGPLGTAGQDEMLMQDASGNFEVCQYNASLNAFVGSAMGAVGAPWVVEGIAAAPATGSTGNSGVAVGSTAQIVQAMASFGAPGAANAPPTVAEGADTSQQTLLTTPHSA